MMPGSGDSGLSLVPADFGDERGTHRVGQYPMATGGFDVYMEKEPRDSYLRWLDDQVGAKSMGDALQITIPFLAQHNDRICPFPEST